jgi:hypothetical protein
MRERRDVNPVPPGLEQGKAREGRTFFGSVGSLPARLRRYRAMARDSGQGRGDLGRGVSSVLCGRGSSLMIRASWCTHRKRQTHPPPRGTASAAKTAAPTVNICKPEERDPIIRKSIRTCPKGCFSSHSGDLICAKSAISSSSTSAPKWCAETSTRRVHCDVAKIIREVKYKKAGQDQGTAVRRTRKGGREKRRTVAIADPWRVEVILMIERVGECWVERRGVRVRG